MVFPFSYARTAYCDVTGRESRLPLRIRGDGAGPKVHFSLDTLDVGNVFINSQHTYEVNHLQPHVFPRLLSFSITRDTLLLVI